MNVELFYFLNNLAVSSSSVSGAAVFLANDFGYLLIVLLGYFLVTHGDKKRATRELFTVICAALAALVVAHAIKYFFYTPRPFAALPDVNLIFPHEADGAFPSGHATFFSALAVAMWFYHKRLAYFFGLGAILIGLSRIISGVHFPVDILGGFVLGSTVAVLAYFLAAGFFRRNEAKPPSFPPKDEPAM